jgi:putative transposase
VEVWTRKGLQRFLVLFFIELSTRRVQIAGISAKGNGLWMQQIARNLTDAEDGLLKGKRYLLHDRDPLFTVEFLTALAEVGVESVKLPPLFGEKSLRKAVREFIAHYHAERNHQGIGNLLIVPDRCLTHNDGLVRCRSRLGGILNYYDRAA